MLELQARWSHIPSADELLIERVKTREGWHLFVYPFEGRLVHEGLAALLAYRLSQRAKISFSLASNDYGVEMLSPVELPLQDALAHGLLSPHGCSKTSRRPSTRRRWRSGNLENWQEWRDSSFPDCRDRGRQRVSSRRRADCSSMYCSDMTLRICCCRRHRVKSWNANSRARGSGRCSSGSVGRRSS